MDDTLLIGGIEITNRLFVGTGKFSKNHIIGKIVKNTGIQVVTVALRRVDLDSKNENLIESIPKECIVMPNTAGARNAQEAVRIARLSRAMGFSDFIKIEVISDNKYLLPDNYETLRATEILASEGFIVLPYMSPDLWAARRLRDAGAAAIMPLGAPIGTNKGLRTRELVKILVDEIDLPVIVDAGLGKPSEAAESMEIGADAVLVNTAIATAGDPVIMAEGFNHAVKAGRKAYISGMGIEKEYAEASSPLTGFLDL